jgi:hypothetical protein
MKTRITEYKSFKIGNDGQPWYCQTGQVFYFEVGIANALDIIHSNSFFLSLLFVKSIGLAKVWVGFNQCATVMLYVPAGYL